MTELTEPLIIEVEGQLLVFRESDSQAGPICVGLTNRGRRCQRPVLGINALVECSEYFIAGTDGSIDVYYPGWNRSAPVEHVRRQRCDEHLDADEDDAAPPTWEIFDPEEHGDLIQANYPLWTPEGIKHAPPRKLREPVDPPSERRPQPTRLADPAEPSTALPVPTALYSYYDADDLPLYIGISNDLTGRERNHIKKSTWMEFVERSTIRRFPSREEALAAEREAIEEELPLFNITHNSGSDARRRLVRYLVDRDRIDLLAPAVSRG